MDEVIFRTEVVSVVGAVYPSNIIQKLFERFSIAVLVDERVCCLIEFVERLEAGEDVVRPLKTLSHGIRHGLELESVVKNLSV